MPLIDFHPSARPAALRREMIESLRANQLDPRGLYLTPRQADLWREVSRQHAPNRPEFRRIYDVAFGRIAEQMSTAEFGIELVGFGSGTGEKEARLCRRLRATGKEVRFTGIDVSESLVREASECLAAAGAKHRRSLVCDLAEVDYLKPWLNEQIGPAPRLITFFGLVPNFTPAKLGKILRTLLRPADVLVSSVHLAPSASEEAMDLQSAMCVLLPQYNNAETLAWLAAGLDAWDIRGRVTEPEMVIGEIEGIPAFVGQALWKSDDPIDSLGNVVFPNLRAPLRIFQSLRYTSQMFERFLAAEFLQSERLAITTCAQEGIWAVRSGN